MEFRRINSLSPYVFATINELRDAGRKSGRDVIDMGFGNPDIPSPDIAVEKLAESARNPRNHRYSASRGIPKLRLAGADVQQVRLGPDQDFFSNLMESWESTWPRPRVIVFSFPHNPTTECVDLAWMQRLVDFSREHEVVLVHDFAYSDTAFDGYQPPSVLQVPGAKDVAVELYTLTKSFSMAGWRVAFMVGNAEIVAALTKLKSYLDYGTFQPIQIAAIVAMNEAPQYPVVVNKIYERRRDALCDGLNRIGWEVTRPKGTMFVWAPIPEPYEEMGSLEFSKFLVQEAKVATAPGVGFGPGGDGFVRFALIENEQRIAQGM